MSVLLLSLTLACSSDGKAPTADAAVTPPDGPPASADTAAPGDLGTSSVTQPDAPPPAPDAAADTAPLAADTRASAEVGGCAASGATMETCQPWGTAACADTRMHPAPSFACAVSRASPNQTTCTCAGAVKVGTACTAEGDCEAGAECVLLDGARQCRKICNADLVVGPNPGPCPTGQQCTPFSGSARYGYCH